MASTRSNKCPKCRCSYSSATHAKKCRGLAGPSLRAWRGRRNASRRNASSMAKAARIARKFGITANASFYDRAPDATPAEPQAEAEAQP